MLTTVPRASSVCLTAVWNSFTAAALESLQYAMKH